MENEIEVCSFINESISNDIRSTSAIGSYAVDRCVRPGSDIDLVIVVDALDEVEISLPTVFYKEPRRIVDPEGERIEMNAKTSNGETLDITVIDHFNTPNNPLVDWYENHIGWCKNAICLQGEQLSDIFSLGGLVNEYQKLRGKRLQQVNEKIEMTEKKILEQDRTDLHIIYELQKYVFIREIISRGLFNRLSIKHAEDSIPDFNEVFNDELEKKCRLQLNINRLQDR